MKIVTAREMRNIDRLAAEKFNLPGIVLMENAGRAAAEAAAKLLGDLRGKKVFFVCGGGNNGGDGFVAARWLHNQGVRVKVFMTVDRGNLKGHAALHFDIFEKMGLEYLELTNPRELEKARITIGFADLVVDALLGTGFQGEMSELYRECIDMMNSSGRPILAVDIPSGVNADTGGIPYLAVQAASTVTFGLPKPGLYLYPGAAHAGVVEVAPIGLPVELLTGNELRQTLITPEVAAALLPRRLPDAHKGNCGHVLAVAGSRGFSGAAYLATQGALRAGAGLVTAGVPDSIFAAMETKTTEAMTLELPETLLGGLGADAVRVIRDFAARASVVLVGPGLGRQEETMESVREIIQTVDRPLVLDADALSALVGNLEFLTALSVLAVLTPHPGEMARLTGMTTEQIQADRIGVAQRYAVEWGNIVVLKGARTIVAFPDGAVFLNPTGNPGMASGGMGDVLAGVIAALIAQGLSSHDAAVLGAYLHGLAGDLVAAGKPVGMTAMELTEKLPEAFFTLERLR